MSDEPPAKRAKSEMSEETEVLGDTAPVQRRSDGKKYVGKGSLVEADLIRAKEEARSKNPDEMTSEEKKEERRIANRLSAFQSRQRRKAIIEDLHAKVAEVTKENEDHRKNNAVLQAQLDVVTQENTLLRQQFAIVAAAQAAKPAAPAAEKKEGESEGGDTEGAAPAPAAAPLAAQSIALALLGAQMMQQQQGGAPQQPDLLGMLGRMLQPGAAAPAAAEPVVEDSKEAEVVPDASDFTVV